MSNNHSGSIRALVTLVFFVCALSIEATVINYWRFEEGSGIHVADQTGLASGTFDRGGFFDTSAGGGDRGDVGWSTNVSSSVVAQTGQPNLGSFRFSAASPDLRLTATGPMNYGSRFTIEFFFWLAGPSTVYSPFYFMSFNDGDSGFILRPDGSDRISFLGGDEDGTGAILYSDSISGLLTQWHHFAFVMNDGSYKFFIDSALVGSGTAPGFDNIILSPTNTFFIGTDNFSGGYAGWLDEIRISNVALEPSQFLNAIPEPSTFVLTTLALGIVMALRKRCCHETSD